MVKETYDAYLCDDCGAVVSEDDGSECGPLYECPECGTRFNRDNSANDNHQCPECNKFSSRVADHCCPECEEGELVGLVRA